MNQFILGDCMEGMKQFPDKFFELAIVDPPYGIERFKKRGSILMSDYSKMKKWDIKPTKGSINFIKFQEACKWKQI